MTILHFVMLLLLNLIHASLTPMEEIKHELHEKHLKIVNIYTDLSEKLIEEEDGNNEELLYTYNTIASKLYMEIKENETASLILTKYKETDCDELITAKISELNCVKGELKHFKTSVIKGRFPYDDFINKLKELNIYDIFKYCLNEYYWTSCGIFSRNLKNNELILERLRFAVEEQIKRYQFLGEKIGELKRSEKNVVKISDLKNNESIIVDSVEANTNPNRFIFEVRIKNQ